jgi:uncharacterized protein
VPPNVLPDDGTRTITGSGAIRSRLEMMSRTATPLLERSLARGRRPTVGRVLAYYAALMVAWCGAWLVHNAVGLDKQSEAIDTLFWTGAKLLIWLLPIPLLVRTWTGEPLVTFLSLRRVRQGVATGVVFGLAFVVVSAVKDVVTRQLGVPTPSPGLVNALVIAPVLEEIVFRGILLHALQDAQVRFWPANLLTALLFLGMHLPGWYFVGSASLTQGIAMVGIVLVGLGAGYSKQRSGSLWGSILFHTVNNLYSAFLK